MTLPRWTIYPALAILATLLVAGIPRRVAAGRSPARPSAPLSTTEYPRVVILGIDGLDPDVLQQIIDEHPERVPAFAKLAAQGDGVRSLGSSNPPQSPVAWSNFITGRNPGGHGIFDFIHRNPETYSVAPSTVTVGEGKPISLPGSWEFPASGGGDTNRSGKAFWTILGEQGVPADVWRMPINFPVEAGKGWSFSGMMTPAVDSAYGEFSFYSTDPPVELLGNEKVFQVQEYGGVIRTSLLGPEIPFKEPNPETGHRPRATLPMTIYVDQESGGAAIDVAGQIVVLRPGEWSDFVDVSFKLLPMGAMNMGGIVRFYLRSLAPDFELYASPVNVDPKNPINPVSEPKSASAEVAERIGDYYTQGMPEDVVALKSEVITDSEFMQQAMLVHGESDRMLEMALDRYLDNEDGGLLFFYYSVVDLCCHMMWRHRDEDHPDHDPLVANQDSAWFTGRMGTTWKHDIVLDLYVLMDSVLGRIRERVGEDTPLIVMSDHGFAPYHRKFSLNTWLLENGYMVLKEGKHKELPESDPDYKKVNILEVVDWSQTRAYGIGFNGLYLNLEGREAQGIVKPGSEANELIAELVYKLEAIRDTSGRHQDVPVVLSAEPASEIYSGERMEEAPDILVGYNSGYGNSDEAAQGFLSHDVLADNLGGTFNGSHLMDPRVVAGTLLTNARIALADPRLEDLTVEILRQYGVQPDPEMDGRPVFK